MQARLHTSAILGLLIATGSAAAQKTSAPAAHNPAAHSLAAHSPAAHSLDMTVQSPESVGFSSERLERLHAAMQSTIDNKQLAGIVTILARHGKVVDYRTYGMRDLESGAAMTNDTIFRDYSMTKPITGIAMMMLYEEGKWLPNDPLAKFIPEFAHLKVYKGVDGQGHVLLEDPDHPPTMGELLSHTAGFTYGFFGDSPVDHMVRDAKLFESKDLHEFVVKVSNLPLLYQPGTRWNYSISMDIEGYIIQKLSGQSLPDYYRDHILVPLGMKDAGFYVPEDKRSRFATNYMWTPEGTLKAGSSLNSAQRDYAQQPTMASGGGGMVSTAEDYYRFAQMLGNGGELDGKRLVAPSSIKLMASNHLSDALINGHFGIGSQQMRPGFGYGYNCAVEYDPQEANLPDGKGTFLWDGAAGTWFWVDPSNDIVFVGMIQRMNGGQPNVQYLSRALVYQALVDPAK